MNREAVKFTSGNRNLTLYPAETPNQPLIVLNSDDEGREVLEALLELQAPPCSLLAVGGLNWDHDMAPWDCPPAFAKGDPMTGGADDYLQELTAEILPKAKEQIPGEPSRTGIAGYSLAGLFALYALYRSGAFDCAASMSGSLWFPDFREYCMTHTMLRPPCRLYLSLGDKEAKTKNPVLRTVREDTEALAAYYQSLGYPVQYELNPGNHFVDHALRTAKGIRAILQ